MAELGEEVVEHITRLPTLNTCKSIRTMLSGQVTDIAPNTAKSALFISADMICDEENVASPGFLLNAAGYVACAAINKPNATIIAMKSAFYAPCKLNETIDFIAQANFDNTDKREVRVIGTLRDIKIYEGDFTILVTREHILKMQENEMEKQRQNRKIIRGKEPL